MVTAGPEAGHSQLLCPAFSHGATSGTSCEHGAQCVCLGFSSERSWKSNHKGRAEELGQVKEALALVPAGRKFCSRPSWHMALTKVPVGLCIPLPGPDGSPQSTSHFWLLQEMAAAFEGWQGHCGHTLPAKVYEDPHLGPHTPRSHC